LGFSPFLRERRHKGGRRVEAGEEWRRGGRSHALRRRRRVAAGGRPCSGGARPYAAREGDTLAEAGRLKQNEKSGTAANVHAVPPSLSSRRCLHLHPAVRTMAFPFPCVVSFPWFHVCERTVEPLGTGLSSSPHGRPPNRAALILVSHATTPCHRAGRART
jgi:hypothetical protein